MKFIKLLSIVVVSLIFLSGCGIKKYNLDNAKIYTTVYPVKYIVESLYGNDSTIESIYPAGVNINEYKLTDKQIEEYSSGDLFVYVGLSNETDIAKSFVNKNRKILIIDSTYGLSSNNLEELWLAPNNFLMLAKNIKNSLIEYLDNTIKEDEVETKYNDLYKKVSWLDAELRNIAKESKANGKNTLVIANNTFKFLEGYGFNIVSLEDIEKSGSEKAMADIKNKFKNSTYTHVIKLSSSTPSELVNDLKSKYNAKIDEISDLVTIKDTASDYVSIQYENITLIRDILK